MVVLRTKPHEIAIQDDRPVGAREFVQPHNRVEGRTVIAGERVEAVILNPERVTVDIGVVTDQIDHPNEERLVLRAGERTVVHAHRGVVDRREIDLDLRSGLPAELVAHCIGEEGVAVPILVAQKGDRAVAVQRRRAVAPTADRDQFQPIDG